MDEVNSISRIVNVIHDMAKEGLRVTSFSVPEELYSQIKSTVVYNECTCCYCKSKPVKDISKKLVYNGPFGSVDINQSSDRTFTINTEPLTAGEQK